MAPETSVHKKVPEWRVLIFPGGTEIGLELRQALSWNKNVVLFSAGAPVASHAEYVFGRHFPIPSVFDPGWMDALRSLVQAQGITHIFPAHDDVILALAEHPGPLPAKVITSPELTCRIVRSKRRTLQELGGVVPVPRLYPGVGDVDVFPVFVKPDIGQGSFNAARADTRVELETLLQRDPTRLILEYLPGEEFTVDCFSDRERGLLYVNGRRRDRMRSGIAMKSAFVRDARFAQYAKAIASRLEFHGAWFFQVKADGKGELKLLEVAARVGGTSALSRAAGVNLPLLSLFEAERYPLDIAPSDDGFTIDRALINRFRPTPVYPALYVDLDDTLIVRGSVNPGVIRLIFQALDRGVRVSLLTRHAGDLPALLQRKRLAGLFDEVIHVRDSQPKGNFIKEADAILIDDSFAERKAVQAQLGIRVYDPSQVEALIDDRV